MTEIDTSTQRSVWMRLSDPFAPEQIEWRQDGKPFTVSNRLMVRCVPFLSATTIRERLDAVVPGQWDFTEAPLNPITLGAGSDSRPCYGFRGSLTIIGVTREDVGQGKDYKVASTDAFKRAAQRFGIGHELRGIPNVKVPAEENGKYVRLLEDPRDVYLQRTKGKQLAPQKPKASADIPICPKCGADMHDNTRDQKPNYRCKDKECGHRIYLNEDGQLPLGDTRTTGRQDAVRDGGR